MSFFFTFSAHNIFLILSEVIWDNRKLNCDFGQVCLVTVDGTDFRILEPYPFNPKWYSHKFKGPGVRYEIAVCIKTGWIVWVNGPFPCGSFPDLEIAKLGLHYMLDDNEKYIADGGYRCAFEDRSRTPTGSWRISDLAESAARARHECINRKLKEFNCLQF